MPSAKRREKNSADNGTFCHIRVVLVATVTLTVENRKLSPRRNVSPVPSTIEGPPDGLLQLESVLYSSSFLGRRWPVFQVRDVVSNESYRVRFRKPTIVAIVSHHDCSPCPKTEHKLLQRFNEMYSDSLDFDILAIGFAQSRTDLLILRKVAGVTFPMVLDETGAFQKWSGANHFPLVFLVSQAGQILASHYPDPQNAEFSKRDLQIFLQFLNSKGRAGVKLAL